MIRIDEIYINTFGSAFRDHDNVCLHWFDPFGSTNIKDLVTRPSLDIPADLHLIFWDQEPVYLDTACVFFQQFCQRYDGEKLLITSDAGPAVDALCNTYRMKVANYFFHGWAAIDWYRGYNHTFLIKPWINRDLDQRFFCPNNIIGGQRKHRVSLLHTMSALGCLANSVMSFPAVCPYEGVPAKTIAEEMQLDITHIDLPLIIDKHSNHANQSHNIEFWDQAENCFCHVVTETAWDSGLFLTEKIFKPIVMQQPFVLVGPRLGLQYLRSYGFKTFSNLWDESYDACPGHERMQAIGRVLDFINRKNQTEIQVMQKEINEIVLHNHNHFYTEFQSILWKELVDIIHQVKIWL